MSFIVLYVLHADIWWLESLPWGLRSSFWTSGSWPWSWFTWLAAAGAVSLFTPAPVPWIWPWPSACPLWWPWPSFWVLRPVSMFKTKKWNMQDSWNIFMLLALKHFILKDHSNDKELLISSHWKLLFHNPLKIIYIQNDDNFTETLFS